MIELMVAVAIVSVMAGIAVPRFSQLFSKAQESTTKGNLASIRSALTIYYSDNDGQYPTNINALTTSSKYLTSFPAAVIPTEMNH